jgi:hypothetical protein
MSLLLARLIIWRVLRARHRERAARLRNLRLINGGGQSSIDDKALPTADMDERGVPWEEARNRGFTRRG